MKQFNEMDHIEMLEREVIHWKGEEEARRGELLSLKRLNVALEEDTESLNAALDKTSQSLKAKKEELNEVNKIRGDLKLQLMDKNDKHNEEMKGMYKKLYEAEKSWAQAVSTASEEREIRKSYKKDLQALVMKVTKSALESYKAKLTLISTTRQKRHILRAFNDKADEVADLKRYIKQLERENSGLLESVTMLSSHAMAEIERGIPNKENENNENARLREALEFYADEETYYPEILEGLIPVLEDNGKKARQALGGGVVNKGVRKDILYKMTPTDMPYALKNIERLYKTDFEIYNTSKEAQPGNSFKRIVFYTTDKPNISALCARIEKEYADFFPQQEIEHTGTIIHANPLFVLEKMSRGEVLSETIDKDVLIYRNAVIMGSGFVYDGQPLKLFTFESLNGDENE